MIAAGLAAASYLSADKQNSANAKANKNSGYVNTTQTTNPWGPDAQYRNWIMDAGADVLGMPRTPTGSYANPYAPKGGSTTGSAWPGVTPATVSPSASNQPPIGPNKGTPQGGGSGDGPIIARPLAATMPAGLSAKQQKQWKADETRKAAGKKGGKQPAGGAKAPAPGTNTTTQQVMDAMYRDVAAPNKTENAANAYTNTLLSGGETNRYREEAAQTVRDASTNENLDRLISELWAGNTPGTAGKAGARGGQAGAHVRFNPAGTSAARAALAANPQLATGGAGQQVGVVDDIQKILRGEITRPEDESGARGELKKIYEGQGIPPEYREMLERQAKEARERNARDVNALFVGANMQGSTPWQSAFARGQSDAEQGFSDSLIGANYQLYGNALGLGQGYDLADQQYMAQALGIGAQYDTAAQDRAAQAEAARSAAASAGAGQAAAIDAQLQMARMGTLSDAIRMQQGGQQFGAQGLTGISGLYSGDTQQALGMVPELSNLNTNAWAALGNVGVGRDQVAASIKNANTAASTQRGIANQQIGWQQQMWNDPLTKLGKFADLTNASSAGYGNVMTTGQDQRNVAPAPYSSPWGQAIAGGVAGYQLAKGY